MPDEHDPRSSDIFYDFEEHTDIGNGRTVGRKIGVVQEIRVKKLRVQHHAIRDSMIYEPRLRRLAMPKATPMPPHVLPTPKRAKPPQCAHLPPLL